jgi:TonB-dependent SusC/RagA subfamily outer membrane receptor
VKDLQLVLTKPCSEQWDDMQQSGAGRYCDRCEKSIVDLTTKSDAELIRFFQNKADSVCGRLLPGQLYRKLVVPPQKINWHWLMPLAVGAIVVTPVQAQNLSPAMVQSDQTAASLSASAEPAVNKPVLGITLSGRVVDNETGKPLKGVSIKQKGFENVLAKTDSTGTFKLSITEEDKAIPFIFEFTGYSAVTMSLTEGMVVKLSAARFMLGGTSIAGLSYNPLYMVFAGKKSCTIDASRLGLIPPEWIKRIEVLKDAKATALYGSKAAHGAVIIEIKKAYAKQIDFSGKK